MHDPTRTTILIADDHPMFRKGLRDVIESETTFLLVGEADNGEEALEMVERLKPKVAVLDLDMPGKNGLEVTTSIVERGYPVSVLILTMYDEAEMFDEAVSLGVKGYILKDSAVLDILNGIRTVAGGEYYFSRSLSGHLVKAGRKSSEADSIKQGIAKLSPTERKVLRLIAESKVTNEIAEALFISPRTVEHHRGHICDKLQLTGAYALVRFALQNRTVLATQIA